MNTGIADAIDISWKLAAVAQGWGGPGLLASYDHERRPIGQIAVREGENNFNALASIPSGPEVTEASEAGTTLRRKIGDYIYANGFEHEYESDGVIFGYHYEGSPIVCTEAGDRPPTTIKHYIPSSRPGHRAPHVWLDANRSTIDLFGRGFVLLYYPGSDPQELCGAAGQRSIPLKAELIDCPDAEQCYGSRMTLVRPDGHVAWRGDKLPVNAGHLLDRVRGA